MRSRIFLLIAVAVCPVLAHARSIVRADDAAAFDIRRAPAWVEPATEDAGRSVDRAALRDGIYAVLTDHQVRVAGAEVNEYFRRVRNVVTAAGVQNASELSIDFDPSYQHLVLHEIALVRDGTRIDQLDPSAVRIIEKEPDSEERIYDGELTALVFLEDVRPGDVIDYSYSLEGSNPLLAGRYADEYDFSASVPARTVRHRLLWPAGRPLHVRGDARVEHRGAFDVYTFERHDVPASDLEDATPDWYQPFEIVQVSEYNSWADVARWADNLFQADAASRAAAAALAGRLRADHRDRDQQIAAAIRFVQDDIRYLGIEMGRGSHQPRQPAVTLRQRYGDCKDKAFLLSLVLHELGLQAWPALVNTRRRHTMDRDLPSPFLFDHVITEVLDGGRMLWVDGTIADQGGMLRTIDTPNDERALVVRSGTVGLTRIAVTSRASVRINRVYTAAGGPDGTLEVVSTYRGREADNVRSKLASLAASEYAKERINAVAADHPRIQRIAGPAISDDRASNVIVVRDRYLLRGLSRHGSWTFHPRALDVYLPHPETLIRSMPLAVEFPADVIEQVVVHGARPRERMAPVAIDTTAFHYEQRAEAVDDGAVLTYVLRTRSDAVPVAAVAEHIAALNDIAEHAPVTFERPGPPVAAWAGASGAVVVLITVLTSLAVRKRRIRTLPKERPLAADPAAVVAAGE